MVVAALKEKEVMKKEVIMMMMKEDARSSCRHLYARVKRRAHPKVDQALAVWKPLPHGVPAMMARQTHTAQQ